MYWQIALGVVILLAALASLWASLDTRRDLASGRPTYLSLADQTGIWDRRELAKLVGLPDDEDRYRVSAEQIEVMPRRFWKRYCDATYADAGCALLAIGGICLAAFSFPAAFWLLLVSGLYQAVGWLTAALVVARHASFPGRSLDR